MKMSGAGVNRGAVMTLNRQRRHPVPGEARRGRKSDQTAADNEHIGFDHGVFPRVGVFFWPEQ
jgi:hypothetical protein